MKASVFLLSQFILAVDFSFSPAEHSHLISNSLLIIEISGGIKKSASYFECLKAVCSLPPTHQGVGLFDFISNNCIYWRNCTFASSSPFPTFSARWLHLLEFFFLFKFYWTNFTKHEIQSLPMFNSLPLSIQDYMNLDRETEHNV